MVDASHMLIAVPNCDSATSILYNNFIYYYIPYIQSKGLWTLHLFNDSACNADNIHGAIPIYQPKGIFQGAHGTKWTMGGEGNDGFCNTMTWWGSWPNCSDADGKIIYFIACNTGQWLGPHLVSDWGALAWAGYNDLCYVSSSTYFRESLGEFWYALCDGCNVGEAYARTISKYNYWIGQTGSTNLIWDRDHFMIVGDTTANLLPEEPVVDDSVEFIIEVQ